MSLGWRREPITPVMSPISVAALFDRLDQVFGPAAAQYRTDLRFRSVDRWVRSDGALLEQVLSNLIGNALRHAGGGLGHGRRPAPRATPSSFQVRDNGPGVAPADQARIFEDFVQLGNAERDRRKGLGLGLAIARRAAVLIDADLQHPIRAGTRRGVRPAPTAGDRSRPPADRGAGVRGGRGVEPARAHRG